MDLVVILLWPVNWSIICEIREHMQMGGFITWILFPAVRKSH